MTDITPAPAAKNPILNDAWYTRLEYLGRVILPALGTLYLALATLWKLPAGEQVVGTVVAVDTFLGLFLGVAQRSYDKTEAGINGTMDVIPNADGTKVFSLNLNGDPTQLQDLQKVTFKVNAPPAA